MKLAVVLLPVVLTPAILATPPAAEAQAAGKLYRVRSEERRVGKECRL